LAETDLVILGSGAAALTMAVTAATAGLKVIVLERDRLLGGTSAISGGALWIPCTRQAIAGGFTDSLDCARTYLQHVTGDCYRSDVIDGFLHHGPEALAFLERHTDLRYTVRPLSPDYYPELPGATDCGRALEVGEFDGRALGPYFEMLRPPPKGMMGLGGMMVNRTDISHFLNMRRSIRSCLHLARLSAKYYKDRLQYSRGTRLVIGNAMVAALVKAAADRGVVIHTEARTASFLTDSSGRVAGTVTTLKTGETVRIHSRGGVALGTGGLSRRADAQTERPDTGDDHLSMAAPAADGSMMSMAERELGAQVGGGLKSSFYWAPMSAMRYGDGSVEVFPHIVTDRAKPGIIAVTDRGVRFTNEANSYHRFVEAMRGEQRRGAARFYLVADRASINAYGLGLVRPRPGLRGKFIRNGYLIEATSIRALAARLEIEPTTLDRSVVAFNSDAAAGTDRQFGRGESSYNRAMGDSSARHPCLAPLQTPPFYAVRIFTGDLGSAKGLVTDVRARVLHQDGGVIRGLYAVGTDMNSVVGGTYPGPGIVLGTGLTFAYIAARTVIGDLRE
jgi:succinate dehydrogenase/fumarate reductase flavoprotein subunit